MSSTTPIEIHSGREQLRPQLAAWVSWVGRGSLAIADQGLFASSNFLLNVLLARWLSPADYGAFALAYSVFLLLLVLHNSLLTGPMLVFGSGKYRDRFPEYLGVLVRGHFALMLPCTIGLATIAFVLGRLYTPAVGGAFWGMAVAGPFILLLWLLRRAFYVLLNPGWAAAGGLAYLVILLAGAAMFHALGRLTPAIGFLTMALGSLITCVFLYVRLRPRLTTELPVIRRMAADHWRYGKWVAAAAAPSWVTENIYYLVLPAWVGLAEAGGLKALLNLAMPATQTISALGTLLLPILVRDRDAGGSHPMKKTINRSLVLFFLGSACYLVLLWGFRLRIVPFLYAGKYTGYASWPLLLSGLLPLAECLPVVVGAALLAVEQSKLAFWSTVGGACIALVIGVPLASILGVGGALAGIVASYVVMGGLMSLFLRRSVHLKSSQPGT